MEPNFCMENGLKTMETMDSMINIGGYGIWEWGINLNVNKIRNMQSYLVTVMFRFLHSVASFPS